MIRRRELLSARAVAQAAPAIARHAGRTLRVIPQANLTSLDPVRTTAVVAPSHVLRRLATG